MISVIRWVIPVLALVILACSATVPDSDSSATPDVPRLAQGEPSELVRRYADRRVAAESSGVRLPGSVRADLEEEYLGDGVWQVWKAIDGRELIRVWRVNKGSLEVEDLTPGDIPPC